MIFVLRTYAIWDRKKIVAYSLIALSIAVGIGAGFLIRPFYSSIVCKRRFSRLFSSTILIFLPLFFTTVGTSPSYVAYPGCFAIIDDASILWGVYLLLLAHETGTIVFYHPHDKLIWSSDSRSHYDKGLPWVVAALQVRQKLIGIFTM